MASVLLSSLYAEVRGTGYDSLYPWEALAIIHNDLSSSSSLPSPSSQIIPSDQVRKGFDALIESVDDTALDVPEAAELLALFIARAVVDDVLPPAFASKYVPGEGMGGLVCC